MKIFKTTDEDLHIDLDRIVAVHRRRTSYDEHFVAYVDDPVDGSGEFKLSPEDGKRLLTEWGARAEAVEAREKASHLANCRHLHRGVPE